jgi:hypothetical protein
MSSGGLWENGVELWSTSGDLGLSLLKSPLKCGEVVVA